jgi:predicted flavoprotein YhiN
MIDCDIAVVGGGAAGHTAAIAAARASESRNSVLLLERSDRVGRKLLATGGGTCNLTNLHVSVDRYHGAEPSFTNAVLSSWSADAVMAFFDEIGGVQSENIKPA